MGGAATVTVTDDSGVVDKLCPSTVTEASESEQSNEPNNSSHKLSKASWRAIECAEYETDDDDEEEEETETEADGDELDNAIAAVAEDEDEEERDILPEGGNDDDDDGGKADANQLDMSTPSAEKT